MKYEKKIKKATENAEKILYKLNRIKDQKNIDLQYYWNLSTLYIELEELNKNLKKVKQIFKKITIYKI